MTASEKKAINFRPMKLKCWHRYMDDVFAVWLLGPSALRDFLSHLNSRYPDISISIELSRDFQLPFLDVLVKRCPYVSLCYTIYRKSTLLQATSHRLLAHNRSIIITLMNRTKLFVTRLARCPNYILLSSFSEQMATPYRTSTEQPRPEP
jgi:hypothetical protein